MNFLNEVANRYPESISFAPGRPHEKFFDMAIPGHYLQVFENYLRDQENLSTEDIQRVFFQYGPTSGTINNLVSRALLRDQSTDVPPEAIVITVGAQEGIFLALRTLCSRPDDVVLITDPSYIGLVGAARLLDLELAPVPSHDTGIDLQGFKDAVRGIRAEGKRPRLLYLVPDFSNPAGYTVSLEDRRALLEFAEQEDIFILEDNPYGFTAPPGEGLPSLKSLDESARVILLGTFAKTCLPGARVGYIVADQPVRDPTGQTHYLASDITTVKSMITLNTSPLGQAVIGGMLIEQESTQSAMIKEKSDFYRANLQRLQSALDRHMGPGTELGESVRFNRPNGGFFVVLQVPFTADDELLEISAREYGVLWTPMSHFYLRGGGRRELRLACSYLSHEEIDTGIARLARFMADAAGERIRKRSRQTDPGSGQT